jgi:hypothetical protein
MEKCEAAHARVCVQGHPVKVKTLIPPEKSGACVRNSVGVLQRAIRTSSADLAGKLNLQDEPVGF